MSLQKPPFPLQQQLGVTIDSPGRGRGRAELEVTAAHHNPNGVVHGAVLFALVDTAMGAATLSVLDPGQACATVEVHLRFLRPVSAGRVVADVTVLKQGRRIVHLEGRVTDRDGNPVATADGTFTVTSGGQ